ncbi:MAG: hypothetical protein ACREBD_24160 [Blastocatellia bacterium]
MRNRIYLLLAALLLCSIRLQAQTVGDQAREYLTKLNKRQVNGIELTFSSFTEGRATAEGIIRMQFPNPDEQNSIACVLINPSTGKFIGYLLTIERLPEPAKLKITIKPAEDDSTSEMTVAQVAKYLEAIWPTKRGYSFTSPPSYPEPIVINITDVIKIPLWVNAGTEWGVIGDQIRFTIAKDSPPGPPKDFTLDDVKFKLSDFRLIINGEVRSGEGKGLSLEGPHPSFFVPGKGIFILSIRPRDGANLQKIGVAEGNKISFSYGGDKYEWVSSEPVIAQGGRWNIWVLLDTDYQPQPELVEVYKLLSKGNCCVFANSAFDDVKKPPSSKK